jgi:hypothetical protein
MHLSGQLTDWSIHDLLQIMQVTKKTGSLDIDGERRGRIHFRNGGVTGAELTGTNGTYTATERGAIADILYVLSTLSSGSFSVGPADGPDVSGWGVEEVVGDVEALRLLEGEVIDAGLFEAAAVRLTDVSEPLTVDPFDWAVMVSLVQPFTFSQLEAEMGRGGAVRVFHTLHRLGIVEPIESADHDDESQWLDDLADGIAPEPTTPTWLEQQTEPETFAPEPLELVPDGDDDEEPEHQVVREHEPVLGVSAPASTTLTDGVYDEIRRLRSKVAER